MIEVTLSNASGRTILYPANQMSCKKDKDANIKQSLSFFGPGEADTQLDSLQPFFDEKKEVGHVNPSALIGECRVVDYSHVEEFISLGDIEFIDVKYKERILVKTPTDRFVYLHSEAADMLSSKEIALFGIDAATQVQVQGERDCSEFATHRKFKDRDVTVIEGLDLSDTPPGQYFLIGISTGLVHGECASARVYLIPL